jgi:hypothetical protein|tara:strand:+ start:344 stop:652 length:309 start_codon:yes stop_codon:yes gene_type:complete
MATKNYESNFTLEKYECYWEDACLITDEWKDIEDAKKNTPSIVCTEGFLIKKNKYYHTFVMTISDRECGETMVIPSKNIKKMTKLGKKTFYKKDFEYKKYQK